MTKYSRLVPKKEKEEVKTVFTRILNAEDDVISFDTIAQDWDNVKLLEGKRDGLDQFLIWDDDKHPHYNILLGRAGSEFDNV
jgi:hypothetical protein